MKTKLIAVVAALALGTAMTTNAMAFENGGGGGFHGGGGGFHGGMGGGHVSSFPSQRRFWRLARRFRRRPGAGSVRRLRLRAVLLLSPAHVRAPRVTAHQARRRYGRRSRRGVALVSRVRPSGRRSIRRNPQCRLISAPNNR